ncbi:hypothetical protein [Pilimelia columellifera]|uniref:Dynactin subunit 6 n=1 Tax=Pilimelia columellifera subsp. columellifera TaxID=706583 RepID=A0ABN3NSV8_9ACTN
MTLTVERGTRIGSGVLCSPGSHITADMVIGDRVFLGAGVRTVNDKELIWRDAANEQPLRPPRFDYACKVGSGAVVLAGVIVGARALVGTGAVVDGLAAGEPATGPVYGVFTYVQTAVVGPFPSPQAARQWWAAPFNRLASDGPRFADPGLRGLARGASLSPPLARRRSFHIGGLPRRIRAGYVTDSTAGPTERGRRATEPSASHSL